MGIQNKSTCTCNTRGSPEPVSVTWLFMYSLGSVKFVQILVVLTDEKEETPYTVHEHLHFLVA
jgi:hypothetical protein